jgi:REP element-mobilizing transposase RayT
MPQLQQHPQHIVFSTKGRRPFIDAALEARLFPYLGGIVRELGGELYVVNGVEDHVHLLAELPPKIAVADAIGKSKAARLTGSISRFLSKPHSRGNVDRRLSVSASQR